MRDAAAVSGLVLIGVGGWLLSPAVGCLLCGVVLLVGAVWGHIRNESSPR